MAEQCQSFYSRLFPDDFVHYPKEVMAELADWMEDTPQHRAGRLRATPGSIPSGYVYFAEFVNHDLSYDRTKLSQAGDIPPEATPNERTPCLDLEILYREGLTDDGHLKLGGTVAASGQSVSDNDLDRDSLGRPNIYDQRNDSTLLLAQLHVLLIKFHNRLLDDVRRGKVKSASARNGFEETKRLVTWHYQWIVRNDLLRKIIVPDVLQDITNNGPKFFRPAVGEASIPVEFSLAAFQYGHSAVNFIYNINSNFIKCPQEATMYLTGLGGFQWPPGSGAPSTRLPEKFVVDPARMFGWAPRAKVNFSATIDTLITEGLYKVPGQLSLLFNNESLTATGLTMAPRGGGIPTFKLPEATLVRGAAVGLPSGQRACQLAGVKALPLEQLAYDGPLETFLRANDLLEQTPLFYYLMREAEVKGTPAANRPPGTRLGPLGSRIVAEVLFGVLSADPDSYVHANWQPPELAAGAGGVTIRIDSLKKMMSYAKHYKSPRQ